MSELKQTLINISEEKQSKIIPENIKAGVEAFGVQGTFTADADATAEDIAKDKTAYVNGEKVVGTAEITEGVDTSLFTGTSCMFRYSTIMEAPLFNTSNVINMSNMFDSCPNLKIVPLYNTSNVNNMHRMYYMSPSLESIPKLDTSKVTSFNGFCSGCSNLVDVPLLDGSSASWTGNGTVGNKQMFLDCPKLSDESLNNILAFCTQMTNVTRDKTLAFIGLSSAQATKCRSLSNYAAFTAAGWTTGY